MAGNFKILVGFDGTAYSQIIVRDLAKAGLPDRAEVFVATVAEARNRLPFGLGGVYSSLIESGDSIEQRAEKIASAGAEKIGRLFPSWSVNYGTAIGSPSRILLAKADEWKPDLIVAGSQSRGAGGRFFFGSVAQSLASNALCSVRIARLNENERAIENDKIERNKPVRLVVGVDGSFGAEAAVKTIVKRQWASDSEIFVVSAMDYVIPLKQFESKTLSEREQSRYYRIEKEKAEKNADRAIKMLAKTGLRIISVIRDKDPLYLLLDQAKENSADCIFVGARGLNCLKKLLLGSVSSTIAVRANCSVEIVRCKS